MKAGKNPHGMTPERALRLTELGFHFDAERFRGKYRDLDGA